MSTAENNQDQISLELKQLLFKEQQLEDRKKILYIFLELRKRAEFEQTEESVANEEEIRDIDNKLTEVREKKKKLQRIYENINAGDKKNPDAKESQLGFDDKDSSIYYVELPPSYPAPKVILDTEKLPPHPCRTQCPECHEFVMTETLTSITSVTWLVCFMSAMIGCVAGCCFIPFCVDKFKSITHRCPKCRTSIITLKAL